MTSTIVSHALVTKWEHTAKWIRHFTQDQKVWGSIPCADCNQIHTLGDRDRGLEFLSWIIGNMYAGTMVINDKWLVINSLNGQA